MTAAAAVAGVLAGAGARRLYTVPGESVLDLLDAAEQEPGLQVVSTRHESGAAFMADADAKLTGLAAVAVGRAVGAANAAIGVHTARQDSTPMVVILGQVKSPVIGREAFQEVDLGAFYAPLAKWVARADRPDRVPELVAEGVRVARAGRPGPAVVVVPGDVLAAPVAERAWPVSEPARPTPSPADVAPLAEALAAARAPVAIAGGGVQRARSELVAFAERYGVGVYAAFRRQDVFPNDHPHYLGHLGIGIEPSLVQALADADLVLALGTRLDEPTTQGYAYPARTARVAQIDAEPATIGATVPVEIGLVADPRRALRALLDASAEAPRRDWSAAHGAYLRSSTPPRAPAGDGGRPERGPGGVHPAEVVAAMRDVLPGDVVLTTDAGNFSGFVHRYWRYTAELSQLAPTSGAMGYAVPAAVAAKLAAPHRPVVAVAGDGGFLMSAHELETAVRLGLPLVCVVFRNGRYATIVMHQLRAFGRTTGAELGPFDAAAYARALGCAGLPVTEASGLRPALEAALAAGRPAVVDVATDGDVLTPAERASALAAGR